MQNTRHCYIEEQPEYNFVSLSLDKKHSSSEKRLLVALLCRSIRDYLGLDGWTEKGKITEKACATNWFFNSEEGPDDAFSYLWVCNHLNIDPDIFRYAIKNLSIESGSKLYEVFAQ